MIKLAKKVAELLPELEARGAIYLYALGEREDLNRWDVMLSAEWSDDDYTGAVRLLAGALQDRLDPAEIVMLARVAIIPSDSSIIAQMPASLESANTGEAKLINVELEEFDLRQMYVFKARRPGNKDDRVAAGLEVTAIH